MVFMASYTGLYKRVWAKEGRKNGAISRSLLLLYAVGCWLGAGPFSAQLSWAEVETIILGEAERPWNTGGGAGAATPASAAVRAASSLAASSSRTADPGVLCTGQCSTRT